MAMRLGDSLGLVAVFASLLMAYSVLMKEDDARGTPVFLPHTCTQLQMESTDRGESRPILVQYQLDRSSYVNSKLMPVEDDLRREIAGLMSTRQEQVISFAADERLTYGDVSAVLSDLRKDDPGLFIKLVTKRQIGPVDEMQLRRVSELCVTGDSFSETSSR
jgi:biopolymer transport protein ExbD